MNTLQLQSIGDVRLHNEPVLTPRNIEVAGEQGIMDTAVATDKPGESVILCGIPSDDHTSFKASTARRKELTSKVVHRMKHTYPRAIELVAAGLIDLESLITHRFSLADSAKAFKVAQAREGLKVIIAP